MPESFWHNSLSGTMPDQAPQLVRPQCQRLQHVRLSRAPYTHVWHSLASQATAPTLPSLQVALQLNPATWLTYCTPHALLLLPIQAQCAVRPSLSGHKTAQ